MIPTEATRIRDLIRKHVPRPDKVARRFNGACPMGLLPHAIHELPIRGHHFDTSKCALPPLYDHEVQLFASWWDDQWDPEVAMDEVWLKAHSGDVIEVSFDPIGFRARSVESDHAMWRTRSQRNWELVQEILDELVRQGVMTPAIRRIIDDHNEAIRRLSVKAFGLE